MLDLETHRTGGPIARISEDRTLPFVCENCEVEYNDYPALIVVQTPEGLLRYCTDPCAEAAGWTEAVVRRWEHEIRGEGIEILFIP